MSVLPATHTVWWEGELSSIPKLAGLPVRLWKSGDICEWVDPPGWEKSGMCADSNQNASFPTMGTDPDAGSWGWAPPHGRDTPVTCWWWDTKARGRPWRMLPCFLISAGRNCRPLFEDSMGRGFVPRLKEEVIEFMTEENMERFTEEARQWMIGI